jgi:hypothetical protein
MRIWFDSQRLTSVNALYSETTTAQQEKYDDEPSTRSTFLGFAWNTVAAAAVGAIGVRFVAVARATPAPPPRSRASRDAAGSRDASAVGTGS